MQPSGGTDRTSSDAAPLPQRAVCTVGAPSFPRSCHKGQHLASSLFTAKEHQLHRVLVPVSLGSLPTECTAAARRAPGGPGSLGDQGRLAFICRPQVAPKCTWVVGGSARARGVRQGRSDLGALSCTHGEGARPVVPSSTALVAPGPARPGARAVPSLLLAGLAPHSSGPRELEQRPHCPLFRLHLLRLLLFLPPATRAVVTGLDWPGCPAKKRGVCVWWWGEHWE